MVKRIYEPGAKYDQVLILEGIQGRGKSRTLRALAGDHWFTDATINVGDKDAILTMRSIWLCEMGELSSMRKADADLLKEFISRTTDRIRVPYGKRTENSDSVSPKVDPKRFTMREVFEGPNAPMQGEKMGMHEMRRVGELLTKMGFIRLSGRDQITGGVKKYWVRR
jgi:hypothetical protein